MSSNNEAYKEEFEKLNEEYLIVSSKKERYISRKTIIKE